MKKRFSSNACGALFSVILIALIMPPDAHAGYLDPVSGSLVAQSFIAVLAFFGRFKARLKKLFRIRSEDE